jgi:hypothetical protein
MLLMLLFRRLPVGHRRLVGLGLMVVGLMVVVTSAALAPGLMVHGVVVVVLGGVLFGQAALTSRRARLSARGVVTAAVNEEVVG